MRNLKYITTIAILIFMISCKKESAEKQVKIEDTVKEVHGEEEHIEVTKAQFDSSKMQLGKFTKQAFPELIKTSGMIDVPPQNKAVITSYYAGNVKKSNLLIGDKIRKGQALVTIANPEFIDMQQEYLEIHEQLNFLKTEYERQKTLFDEKITSQKKLLKSKK